MKRIVLTRKELKKDSDEYQRINRAQIFLEVQSTVKWSSLPAYRVRRGTTGEWICVHVAFSSQNTWEQDLGLFIPVMQSAQTREGR
jgi:hypothetical protein